MPVIPLRRWCAVAVAALLLAGPGAAPAFADDAPVTVYVDTTGDDSAVGDAAHPVRTLNGARDLLARTASDTAEIVVRAGTYHETSTVDWSGVPQHHIALRRDGGTQRPVFDGSFLTGTAQYWMDTHGGPSLTVRDMLVQHYRTGGLRLDTDGNLVRNMMFVQLGNHYVPGGEGYAAVHLLGSSDNTVTHNIFRQLENDDCPGCIHGLYAANGSSRNVITDNTFDRVIGDVIRLRNGTDDNLVSDNTFTNSGEAAVNRAEVSFWRFRATEVCGTGNRVIDNRWDGRYYDGTLGQQMAGSGAEPGLDRCTTAISHGGSVRI